jgi:polar amino acid transport system ATP-binding protein
MRITAQKLFKRYGEHAALDGVSFEVPAEAGTVALLGPSGSGKSTLLRVLGSLLLADDGSASLDGQALSHLEAEALKQRRGNGFVFQSFNLFPHLTALENVALPLRAVHRMADGPAHVRALEVLERFGLADHLQKHPAQLSGGQQQRVALARAIAPKPKLLLLDEPTSALDPMMTQEVLEVIRTLAESGQQIVLSTHEISFAKRVADWIVFLDRGKVIESSAAQQFFSEPDSELARQFLEALTRYR